MALVLCLMAVRATEVYTARFQSLPVLDWLESREPLTDSADVPPAADLTRGLARTMPLMLIRDDARPWAPVFGPPAVIQRSMGGVRDASRIVLTSTSTSPTNQAPVQVRLYTVVFNRTLRAAEWTELMGREMDIRDPDSGMNQSPVSGPDKTDAVWVVSPIQTGGIATVIGHRGPVGFDLQLTLGPTPDVRPPTSTERRPEVADLSAHAEQAARLAVRDWTDWVQMQIGTAGR
jgi:hypothetical protein